MTEEEGRKEGGRRRRRCAFLVWRGTKEGRKEEVDVEVGRGESKGSSRRRRQNRGGKKECRDERISNLNKVIQVLLGKSSVKSIKTSQHFHMI